MPCICTHLDISSLKSMMFHIVWVTTGAHNPVIQIWLELYCLEGVNVVSLPVRDEACLQNSIECHCTPGLCRVRSERHIQLFSIVVCNPLSQFLGQHEMAATVHVLNRQEVHAISDVYTSMSVMYMVYTWNIHSISMRYPIYILGIFIINIYI